MSYIQTNPTLTITQADTTVEVSYPEQAWPYWSDKHFPKTLSIAASTNTESSVAPTSSTDLLNSLATPELSESMACTETSGTPAKDILPKKAISSNSVSIEFPLKRLQKLQEYTIKSKRSLEATKYPHESLPLHFPSLTPEQKAAVEILIKDRLRFNAAWSKIISDALKYFCEKYLQSFWTENGWDLRAWDGEGWELQEARGVGEVAEALSDLQTKMYCLDLETGSLGNELQNFVKDLAAIEVWARNGPTIDSELGWTWSRKMSVFDEDKDKAQKEWAKVEAEWAEKEASAGLRVVF